MRDVLNDLAVRVITLRNAHKDVEFCARRGVVMALIEKDNVRQPVPLYYLDNRWPDIGIKIDKNIDPSLEDLRLARVLLYATDALSHVVDWQLSYVPRLNVIEVKIWAQLGSYRAEWKESGSAVAWVSAKREPPLANVVLDYGINVFASLLAEAARQIPKALEARLSAHGALIDLQTR